MNSPSTSTRPRPEQFIEALRGAQPGWSQQFGGADGVITLTGLLLEEIAEQSRVIAEVRTAAIRQQLRTEQGAVIARRHRLSRQAIHRASRATRAWEGEIW